MIVALQAELTHNRIVYALGFCFCDNLLDALGQVVRASLSNLPHLLIDVVVIAKQLKDLFPGNHEQLRFDFWDGHSASNILSFVQDSLHVTEIGTLDAHINGHILCVTIRALAKNVVVELDSAFADEEYFLSWIVLAIQGIVFINLHLAEQRKHLPDEFLSFVIEEANLSNYLSVRVRYNLRLKVWWQFVDEFLLVKLLQVFVMVILQEAFNFFLDLCW